MNTLAHAQQCIQQSQRYINEGYGHIVDIDLKSFFDEVDHCILLQRLYRKVKCPVTLRLIRKWLRVDITDHSLPLISEHSLPAFQSKVYHLNSV